MNEEVLLRRIQFSAQLAAILEVSGWPKPGNVHRTADHSDARYEHFLSGSIILGSAVRDAALKGLMVVKKQIDLSQIEVGKLVKTAVSDISQAHYGGNTHLGTCLLFIPLAAAAAKTYAEKGGFKPEFLRKNVKTILESTTPRDAIEVYNAILLVSSFNELGEINDVPSPDLFDRAAKQKIITNHKSLLDVMQDASSYDTVAKELVTGMEISFDIGYKELMNTFTRTKDINVATVHTFLLLLSKFPDTFIARKIGLKATSEIKKAVKLGRKEIKWISEKAKDILKIGGLTTKKGKASIIDFDKQLHRLGKEYSPGTTADLLATSLMIALLCGLKF